MSEIQSKWIQTDDGAWLLSFNCDYKEEIKLKKNIFYMKKQFKLGCLVMTPLGIGTLIKQSDNIFTIKYIGNNFTTNFEDKFVSLEFNNYVKIFSEKFKNCYRLTVPANGNISYLKYLIDKMIFNNNLESFDFTLIYNGSELLYENNKTFEQMNFMKEDKVLLCSIKQKAFTLKRYTQISEYRFVNPESVRFSVNKKIKLTGVSVYSSMEVAVLYGDLIIYEVSGINQRIQRGGNSYRRRARMTRMNNYKEKSFFCQKVEIKYVDESKTCKIQFSEPIYIKPFQDYKIELKISNPSKTWYGKGGQLKVTTECGVEFIFMNGTTAANGNFSEFHYFM